MTAEHTAQESAPQKTPAQQAWATLEAHIKLTDEFDGPWWQLLADVWKCGFYLILMILGWLTITGDVMQGVPPPVDGGSVSDTAARAAAVTMVLFRGLGVVLGAAVLMVCGLRLGIQLRALGQSLRHVWCIYHSKRSFEQQDKRNIIAEIIPVCQVVVQNAKTDEVRRLQLLSRAEARARHPEVRDAWILQLQEHLTDILTEMQRAQDTADTQKRRDDAELDEYFEEDVEGIQWKEVGLFAELDARYPRAVPTNTAKKA